LGAVEVEGEGEAVVGAAGHVAAGVVGVGDLLDACGVVDSCELFIGVVDDVAPVAAVDGVAADVVEGVSGRCCFACIREWSELGVRLLRRATTRARGQRVLLAAMAALDRCLGSNVVIVSSA
jgi:hypothetical protein